MKLCLTISSPEKQAHPSSAYTNSPTVGELVYAVRCANSPSMARCAGYYAHFRWVLEKTKRVLSHEPNARRKPAHEPSPECFGRKYPTCPTLLLVPPSCKLFLGFFFFFFVFFATSR